MATAERGAMRRFLVANLASTAVIAGLSLTGSTWLASPILGRLPLSIVFFAAQACLLLATAWRFDRHSRTEATPDGSSQSAGAVTRSNP
ncbi:hypothetical protein ABZ733_31035 [Streptomyces longwoodensis]|uniref:hypothetical protein n=1 Tax=Streptomyces longwoodensis TaxID=68231 RepID=UPI0033DE5236